MVHWLTCRGHRRAWLGGLVGLVVLVVAACAAPLDDPGGANDVLPVAVEVILYFPDQQAQQPVPERRMLDGEVQVTAAMVVEALLAGPQDPYLLRPFPVETELNSVVVADGVAAVDLSAEAAQMPGSAGARLAMLSLRYSLTELDRVEAVQLLIDGEIRGTIGGLITSEPMARGGVRQEMVFVDQERAAWLQAEADDGRQLWRLDPARVVTLDSRMLGFTGQEDFTRLETDDEEALYRVTVEGVHYLLELIQPARRGAGGIWMLAGVDVVAE